MWCVKLEHNGLIIFVQFDIYNLATGGSVYLI